MGPRVSGLIMGTTGSSYGFRHAAPRSLRPKENLYLGALTGRSCLFLEMGTAWMMATCRCIVVCPSFGGCTGALRPGVCTI